MSVTNFGFPIVDKTDPNNPKHGPLVLLGDQLQTDAHLWIWSQTQLKWVRWTGSFSAEYTQLYDYVGGNNVIYLGRALPGSLLNTAAAIWQIRRFTYDGADNVLAVSWASSSAEFDQIWDNRAALAYA